MTRFNDPGRRRPLLDKEKIEYSSDDHAMRKEDLKKTEMRESRVCDIRREQRLHRSAKTPEIDNLKTFWLYLIRRSTIRMTAMLHRCREKMISGSNPP